MIARFDVKHDDLRHVCLGYNTISYSLFHFLDKILNENNNNYNVIKSKQ